MSPPSSHHLDVLAQVSVNSPHPLPTATAELLPRCCRHSQTAAAMLKQSCRSHHRVATSLPFILLPPLTLHCRQAAAAAAKLPLPLPPWRCCCRAIAMLLPPPSCRRQAGAAPTWHCCCHRRAAAAADAALPPSCRRRRHLLPRRNQVLYLPDQIEYSGVARPVVRVTYIPTLPRGFQHEH
jgi:hypothetical protein